MLVLLWALFYFITGWFDNFVNQWPATLFLQPGFQGRILLFFFPPNHGFKWLLPVSLSQEKGKKHLGSKYRNPPCCHSVILNCKGQSPLLWRMVSALEWAEVQCLASLLTHLKISLTCLSSWNTFNRPFWKSCSHEAVPLLLSASACYQTDMHY